MKTEQRYDLIVEADWQPCVCDPFDTGDLVLSDMIHTCMYHHFSGESGITAHHYDTSARGAIDIFDTVKHQGRYHDLKHRQYRKRVQKHVGHR